MTAPSLRPEIQGLRAVAVMTVVVCHFWPSALPGGFVGVDVFFVISGFLITSQLLREAAATGRVRLSAFWARRARRILPAALLLLALAPAARVPRPAVCWAGLAAIGVTAATFSGATAFPGYAALAPVLGAAA